MSTVPGHLQADEAFHRCVAEAHDPARDEAEHQDRAPTSSQPVTAVPEHTLAGLLPGPGSSSCDEHVVVLAVDADHVGVRGERDDARVGGSAEQRPQGRRRLRPRSGCRGTRRGCLSDRGSSLHSTTMSCPVSFTTWPGSHHGLRGSSPHGWRSTRRDRRTTSAPVAAMAATGMPASNSAGAFVATRANQTAYRKTHHANQMPTVLSTPALHSAADRSGTDSGRARVLVRLACAQRPRYRAPSLAWSPVWARRCGRSARW